MATTLTGDATGADLTRRAALAYALGSLFLVSALAVDPYGLVRTGPLRWTAGVAATGVALALWCLRPAPVDRRTAWCWGALVVWMLIATIAAADPHHAWIGTPDRRLGFIAWVGFPLLFFAGQSVGQRADRALVLRGATLAAIALGVWCAFERAGFSLLGASFASNHVGGSFGQPAYLGAIGVLLAPLATAVACDRGAPRAWRVLGGIGASAMVLAVLGSQTRGAWLGLFVAGVIVAVRRRDLLRRVWPVLVVAGVLLALLFVVTPLGSRATSAFDLDDGTARGRLDDWRIASKIVRVHPVFGVGPEGYRVEFPGAVDADYAERYGTAIIPDRAHNGVIDLAAIGGLPAALLYGALLVLVIRATWRALRRPDPAAIGIAAAALAYVVQQAVLFPLEEIDPLFWIVAGILFTFDDGPRVELPRPGRVGVVIISIVTLAAVVFGAREVVADRELRRAADATGITGLAHADRATRLRSDSIRTWFVAGRVAGRGEALTDLDAAGDRFAAGLRRSPRDPALRRDHARILVLRAARSQLPADAETARRVLAGYLADAPQDTSLLVSSEFLASRVKP